MKLALFSQGFTTAHKAKLASFFDKPLSEVRFLYINTASNYKPYKSKWLLESEKKWQATFPDYQEFDLERAIRVDPDFDFLNFFSAYDFIFVSGGNTFVLSYWMHKTGSDKIIKNLINEDKVVYGGESAGSIYVCKDIDAYKQVDNPEKAIEKIDEGLNLVDFMILPHWGNSDFQNGLEIIDNEFKREGLKVYKINDDQALFINDNSIDII